jgi:hypothetical protein
MTRLYAFRRRLAILCLFAFVGSVTAPTAEAFFRRFVRRTTRRISRRTRRFFSRRTVRRVFSTRRFVRRTNSFRTRYLRPLYRPVDRATERVTGRRVTRQFGQMFRSARDGTRRQRRAASARMRRVSRFARRHTRRGYRFVRRTAMYLMGRRRGQSRSVAFSRRMIRRPTRRTYTRTRHGSYSRAPYARRYSYASYSRRRAAYRRYRRRGRYYRATQQTRGLYRPPTRITQAVSRLGGLSKEVAKVYQRLNELIASGATSAERRTRLIQARNRVLSASRRTQEAARTLSMAVRRSYLQWGRTGRNLAESTQRRYETYANKEYDTIRALLQEVSSSKELNGPTSQQ